MEAGQDWWLSAEEKLISTKGSNLDYLGLREKRVTSRISHGAASVCVGEVQRAHPCVHLGLDTGLGGSWIISSWLPEGFFPLVPKASALLKAPAACASPP